MPTKERFTNNISNPLLKTINSSSGLMEFPNSTDRKLQTLIHGDDSGTPTAIAVNSSGHLLVDIEPDPETGLATSAKQDQIIANQTNGTQVSQVTGNTEADGSGDIKHLHLDGSGNVLSSIVSTVNVSPANSVNSHITDDPANSVAVGLKGRTTIGTATTETFLNCDSDGHLKVDVVSGTVTASVSSAVIKANDGNDGSGTDRTVKCDSNGALIVDASKEGIVTSNGTTEALHCMMMGTNDNVNLRTVKCDGNGVVSVDNSANTQPVESTYTFGSEFTIINAQTIANSASFTSGEFEIQSVKNIQTILSMSISAGGSTNYDVDFEGSLNGSDFFPFPDATLFGTGDALVSSESSGFVPVRYMKVKITNKHGSGSHVFTVKGSVLGATLATP